MTDVTGARLALAIVAGEANPSPGRTIMKRSVSFVGDSSTVTRLLLPGMMLNSLSAAGNSMIVAPFGESPSRITGF
jgi:hypothetical protein